MDERSRLLSGEPTWIRSNIEVFSKGSALKSHDWIQLVQSAGDYLFAEVFEDQNISEAIFSLLSVCNKLLTWSSPYGRWDEQEEKVQQEKTMHLKVEVIEALTKIEFVVPKTDLPVMFHLMVHVPDMIFRWNSVRNFWCFFSERYVS